jgi:hypothetical protein
MDELVKERRNSRGLFFVEPDKHFIVRNRRNKPCQISIPEAREKR